MKMKNKLILMYVMSLHIHTMYASEKEKLMEIAYNYLQFVHDVGSVYSVKSDDSRIAILFADNLTKIDNRITLFANNRQLLLPQMKGFEKEDNPEAVEPAWIIDSDHALIIPSTETNSVIAYFEWVHVHVGRATTMAILQCNDNGQIERITDVWAKVQQ